MGGNEKSRRGKKERDEICPSIEHQGDRFGQKMEKIVTGIRKEVNEIKENNKKEIKSWIRAEVVEMNMDKEVGEVKEMNKEVLKS